jgi:hypothetical protein
MSWTDMKLVFAISYAQSIRAIAEEGAGALRTEIERWEPETREAVAGALAEVV